MPAGISVFVGFLYTLVSIPLAMGVSFSILLMRTSRKNILLQLPDNSKYIEKCQALLNTGNFEKLGYDNSREVEEKVQKTLFKIKNALGEEKYKEIYPSGSNPGRFYGTAKVHKVKQDEQDKCGKLPLRPIVPNIMNNIIPYKPII